MTDPVVDTIPGGVRITAEVEVPTEQDGGSEQGPDRNGVVDAGVGIVSVAVAGVKRIVDAALDEIEPSESADSDAE